MQTNWLKTAWLFETSHAFEDIDKIAEEVRRQGMEAKFADSLDERFDHTYLDLFPNDSCVVFYGTLGFAGQIFREASWVPGVYCHRDNLKCSAYYPHFGKFLISNYIMLPYGALKQQKNFLYHTLGIADALFIRPNSGNKIFTGQLVYRESFDKDIELMTMSLVDPGEIVVVFEPRNIVDEWRFVIADHRVLTGSSYIRNREMIREREDLDLEAAQLAMSIVDIRWQPERVWTLDICRTAGNQYYLLEINSFSCSGLYDCDLEPIVREVSRIAYEDWLEVNSI